MKLIYWILVIMLVSGCAKLDTVEQPTVSQPTDFDSCVAAGNPVMESYPRQCKAGDKTFTEEITEPEEFCGTSTEDPCETNEDCVAGGCSGSVCQSKNTEPIFTTCEYRECYNAETYNLECKCVKNKCMWN